MSPARLTAAPVAMPARWRGLAAPPASDGFYAGRAIWWRYVWSWAAVEVIVQRIGAEGLDRLLRVMQRRLDFGGRDAGTDRVLRRVIGLDGAQLADATSARLRERARR